MTAAEPGGEPVVVKRRRKFGIIGVLVFITLIIVIAGVTAVLPARILLIGPTADANTLNDVDDVSSQDSWNGSYAVLDGTSTLRWDGVSGALLIKARTSEVDCEAALDITIEGDTQEVAVTDQWQTLTGGMVADQDLVKLISSDCPIDLEWLTTRTRLGEGGLIKLWDDPNAAIDEAARSTEDEQISAAAVIPSATWLSESDSSVQRAQEAVDSASAVGAMAVLVMYNVVDRDCEAKESAGGVENAEAYQELASDVAGAIGGTRSVMIVEPDALSLDCGDLEGRVEMIAGATRAFVEAGARVYIDAGHSRWRSADTMAELLVGADIAAAAGFAINVSNFIDPTEAQTYGDSIVNELEKLGVSNIGYIVDISRSGAEVPTGEFCNPAEARLGGGPTLNAASPNADGLLWIKPPGESDGECGIEGAPPAGEFWVEGFQALLGK